MPEPGPLCEGTMPVTGGGGPWRRISTLPLLRQQPSHMNASACVETFVKRHTSGVASPMT